MKLISLRTQHLIADSGGHQWRHFPDTLHLSTCDATIKPLP